MRASYFRRKKTTKKKDHKFKSGLENTFATKAFKLGLPFEYEPDKFRYSIVSHYTPDWKIGPKTYIETKGYLSPSNRMRLLCFKEQYPDIMVYILFQNSRNKINAKSKTTYGEWATRHQIPWADIKDGIPKGWWKV